MNKDSIPITNEQDGEIPPPLSTINIDEILNKIHQAIKDFDLITKEDNTILVGLSGGADSMTLTHYLKFFLKKNVIACHVNHQLRGEESQRDMEFVENICKEYQIFCKVFSIDVPSFAQNNSLTIEEAGRQLRYEKFSETAALMNATKIATAHTLSDNAETMLINLTRGTGLKGLCAIPPKRDMIIRPLIYLTRLEILQYCEYYKIKYVTDSTNLETVYTRNKLRHLVMPELQKVNPQIYSSINKTISVLRQEEDYLAQAANCAYEDCIKSDGLSLDTLLSYHKAIRYRVLSIYLSQLDIKRSSDLIAKLDKIAIERKGKLNVQSEIFVEAKKGFLSIDDTRLVAPYFEMPLELGIVLTPTGKRYEFSIRDSFEMDTLKKVYKKLLYIALDYDKIIGKLVLRQRKIGDKITPVGRNGTHSIKKLFIDDKLTAAQKSARLVLADDKSVVAVEGYGCDKRVAIDEKTKHILLMEQ